eukprot:15352036-Ditylum_brightwellii.AAC.2
MRQLNNCQWTIQPYSSPLPSNFHSVVLYFNRLSIPLSSDLLVYEGEIAKSGSYDDENNGESTLLWHCRGCKDEYPPILASKSGLIHVILISREASANPGWTGFEAEYYTIHYNDVFENIGVIGPGDGTIHLKMASQLSVVPPIVSDTDSSPTLFFPLDIMWHIEPHNLPDTDTVILTFNSLSLGDAPENEYTSDCLCNLTVYDGIDVERSPILNTYCFGSSSSSLDSPPWDWIVSSGPNLTVRLRTAAVNDSASDVKKRMFVVSQKNDRKSNQHQTQLPPISFDFMFFSNSTRYQCGYEHSRKPGIYRAPSMIITDGSGRLFDSDSDHGKHKASMETSLDCAWLIKPNVPGIEAVSVIFELMDIRG